MRLRAEVAFKHQLEQALTYDSFELLYVPEGLLDIDIPHKEKIIAVPPVFLGDCEEYVVGRFKKLRDMGFECGLAHTVGHIPVIEEAGMNVYGGMRLNVTNSGAAEFFAEQGVSDLILSCELTAAQINALSCDIPKGIIGYGRLPLMVTRRCPANNGKPCGGGRSCGKFIVDRRGEKIKTLCSNTVELLNPDVLTIADKLEDFYGVDFLVMRFTDEKDIITVTRDLCKGKIPKNGFTRGLYYRGVE